MSYFVGQKICLWQIFKLHNSTVIKIESEVVVEVTQTLPELVATCGNDTYKNWGQNWHKAGGGILHEAVSVWNDVQYTKSFSSSAMHNHLMYAASAKKKQDVRVIPKGDVRFVARTSFYVYLSMEEVNDFADLQHAA